jgi:ABC-type multidrug transport system fused ATPase/permease subunit
MKILAWVILFALLLLGAFVAVNWDVLTTPAALSLVFMSIEGPLGVLLLALTLGLMVLFALYAMALRASLLSTVHRLTLDLQAQRELADRAEVSRFTELREFAEREFSRVRAEIQEVLARTARAAQPARAAEEESDRSARHDYIRKMQLILDEWDAELDRLEAQAGELKEEAREECRRQIDELKAKKAQARAKLEELRREGGEAWDDLKAGLESAWDSIGRALMSARERFSRRSQ